MSMGRGALGVAMVPVADEFERWDFLVLWQRGTSVPAVRALIDAFGKSIGRIYPDGERQ